MGIEFDAYLASQDQKATDNATALADKDAERARKLTALKEIWASLGLAEEIDIAVARLHRPELLGVFPVGISPREVEQDVVACGVVIKAANTDSTHISQGDVVLRAVIFQYPDPRGQQLGVLKDLDLPDDQIFITIEQSNKSWNKLSMVRTDIPLYPTKRKRFQRGRGVPLAASVTAYSLPPKVEPFDPDKVGHYKDVLDGQLTKIAQKYYRPRPAHT